MRMYECILVLLTAVILAVVLFAVLSAKVELPVDNNAVWNGVCIMVAGFMVTVFMGKR